MYIYPIFLGVFLLFLESNIFLQSIYFYFYFILNNKDFEFLLFFFI